MGDSTCFVRPGHKYVTTNFLAYMKPTSIAIIAADTWTL